LIITRYRLLMDGWRGYLIAGFSLVWIANLYMSLFGRLRLGLKSQRMEIVEQERQREGEVALASPDHSAPAPRPMD
jgi:hypothetical protein